MIGELIMLAILVLGLNIMLGRGRVENYYKFLIWLIFAPILVAIGWNHLLWFWYGLSPLAQTLSVLLLPLVIAVALRTLFPGAAWPRRLAGFILETLVLLIAFPFRLTYRIVRLFLSGERGRPKLNPHPVAVGSKPPVIAQDRSKEKKDIRRSR